MIDVNGFDASVRDAYARANGLYFTGAVGEMRKATLAAVSEGRKVPVSVADWDAGVVEEQGAATKEIVRNVGQAAAGTGEVTTNVAGVAGAAGETRVAASQTLESASSLLGQSDHLAGEVRRFLDTVRAA